jgi:hypothetical protein
MSTRKQWDASDHYLSENWTAVELWQSMPRWVKGTFVVIAIVFLLNVMLFVMVV